MADQSPHCADGDDYITHLNEAADNLREQLAAAGREDLPAFTIYDDVKIFSRDKVRIMPGARIDSWVKIEGGVGQGVYIGRHVHIASFCHIGIGGGETYLGDYSAYASGAKIISGSNRATGLSCSACAPPEMQDVRRFRTIVREFAFVSTNAVVHPGVTIGQGAVLAPGAVAVCDVPHWEIWGGVPARKIGERRIDSRFRDLADKHDIGRHIVRHEVAG